MTDTVQATPASTTSVGAAWPRPLIVPLPKTTAGVQSPVIPLSGAWKLHTQPPKGFWSGAINPASWRDVPVPSDLHTSGINIPDGQEYAYAREVEIPADFAGRAHLFAVRRRHRPRAAVGQRPAGARARRRLYLVVCRYYRPRYARPGRAPHRGGSQHLSRCLAVQHRRDDPRGVAGGRTARLSDAADGGDRPRRRLPRRDAVRHRRDEPAFGPERPKSA